MITDTDFSSRQTEARDRLTRMEAAIAAQTASQSGLANAADMAADGTVAGMGAAGRALGSFGQWLSGNARWLYEHAPGREQLEAIAQEAWRRAERELESRSSEFRDLRSKIQAIQADPMGFAQNAYNSGQRWRAHRNADQPHIESPRGTIKFDGAFWENSRAFPEELIYKANPGLVNAGTLMSRASSGGAHLSDSELTFLYLDVGRWGGVPADGDGCRRDFGIFAGRTAAICEFGSGIHGGGLGTSIPASRTDIPAADREAINRVLARIVSDGGSVQVVRALAARTIIPEGAAQPNKVYIALGDMHLPVLTSLDIGSPPSLQLGRFEFDDAAFRFGLKGTIAVNQAVVDRAKAAALARLPDWAPDVAREIIGDTIERLRMSRTGYLGTIGTFDRQLWLDAYRGADIFKEASNDLSALTRAMEIYHREAASNSWPQLHLLQLGDMFDLWIGMLCYFLRVPESSSSPHFQLDGTWAAPTATEFVNYWIESTLWNTRHSRGVANFLSYAGPRTFLYGNHDNYLSPSGATPPSLSALGGNRTANTGVLNHFFAEHGHRPDSFNKDGAILGWLITQSAFRQPAVRSIEPSSRYAQVIAAADHWLVMPMKYCHYVMGHTHQAALARVVIESL